MASEPKARMVELILEKVVEAHAVLDDALAVAEEIGDGEEENGAYTRVWGAVEEAVDRVERARSDVEAALREIRGRAPGR